MKPMRASVAALALSATALAGIALHEGFRSRAYDDGVGVQTIGFGTTNGVKPGDSITPERALVRLVADADAYQVALRKCIAVPLYPHEWDAYISLTYNIGTAAFCSSTLLRLLNAGNYAGACAQISRWNRAGGKVMSGLTKRRASERALCEGRIT